jgi:hypothetical protein
MCMHARVTYVLGVLPHGHGWRTLRHSTASQNFPVTCVEPAVHVRWLMRHYRWSLRPLVMHQTSWQAFFQIRHFVNFCRQVGCREAVIISYSHKCVITVIHGIAFAYVAMRDSARLVLLSLWGAPRWWDLRSAGLDWKGRKQGRPLMVNTILKHAYFLNMHFL